MPESGAYCRNKYDTSVRQGDCLYRNQLESLQTVNRAVVQITDALAEAGELKNTWIFFTSDQGIHLGQHRLDYGKLTPYETDTGFPLIVRGPGVPTGAASERLTGNHDLAPTFADIAGTDAPGADGRSLLPVLTGEPEGWRTALFAERRRFADDPPRAGGPQDVPAWEAVRTERYSYVEYPGTGERELYDLEADPHQLRNLLHKPTPEAEARAAELSVRLNALEDCVGDSCRAAEDAP